jgi:hypothetical protein
MATAADFAQCRELFARLTWKQCASLLDEAMAHPDQQGVRQWLAGGDDPKIKGASPLLNATEAAAVAGVERQRIYRWEEQGRLARVATAAGGGLYYRGHVLAVKAEEDERGTRRSRGVVTEPVAADA